MFYQQIATILKNNGRLKAFFHFDLECFGLRDDDIFVWKNNDYKINRVPRSRDCCNYFQSKILKKMLYDSYGLNAFVPSFKLSNFFISRQILFGNYYI
ncbi:unnamed protein product [Meloidogyne enterolobii]|uniref:Uncharacterized protein n=1 Tax=Meloidogyne enterolobii TaxID=390850 RepID=A0ACB0ZQ62_MELEN